jgi:hypothetical protein
VGDSLVRGNCRQAGVEDTDRVVLSCIMAPKKEASSADRAMVVARWGEEMVYTRLVVVIIRKLRARESRTDRNEEVGKSQENI